MILLLRTDAPEARLCLADAGQVVAELRWQAHRELSQTILVKIEESLKAQKKILKDLIGIVVFKGPGSFTGLRIGITVANTLGYSLRKPVVGAMGEDWMSKGIKLLETMSTNGLVFPEYGAEPHITQQRK